MQTLKITFSGDSLSGDSLRPELPMIDVENGSWGETASSCSQQEVTSLPFNFVSGESWESKSRCFQTKLELKLLNTEYS